MHTTKKQEISATIIRRFTPQPPTPTAPKLVIQYLCNGCNQREVEAKGYCSTCGIRQTVSSDWANALRAGLVTLGLFAVAVTVLFLVQLIWGK